MGVLGLRFCARAFSSCGERGPLFIAVRGPLTIAASLVAEHRLQRRRLSSCGSWAQLLRGMWDLPGPGLEPVFPALAGRFSTTAPPGKPNTCSLSLFVRVGVSGSSSSTGTLGLEDTFSPHSYPSPTSTLPVSSEQGISIQFYKKIVFRTWTEIPGASDFSLRTEKFFSSCIFIRNP